VRANGLRAMQEEILASEMVWSRLVKSASFTLDRTLPSRCFDGMPNFWAFHGTEIRGRKLARATFVLISDH
jgi:hypothetical protein